MYKNLPTLSQLPFSLECLILQLVTVSLHEPKVLEKYRLYATTIEQILSGLTSNQNPSAIHKLTDQKPDNHLIGHYIKVKEILSLYNYKPSLNMTVLFDPHTENYSIIIKSPLQDGGKFTKPIRFEGSYKQATESIHISLTPEGQLLVQPVVSFRPNVSRALWSPKVQKQITKLIKYY